MLAGDNREVTRGALRTRSLQMLDRKYLHTGIAVLVCCCFLDNIGVEDVEVDICRVDVDVKAQHDT